MRAAPLLPVTRREALRMGAAGAAVLGLGGCFGGDEDDPGPARSRSPARRAGRLNVVVVVIDNVRADHVGAYGSRDVRTPSLDALAGEGTRFARARPEAFPTVPARQAILTGRRSFPFEDWEAVPDLPEQPGWSPIPRDRATFLQTLGVAGYRTGYVTDNPWVLSPPYRRFRDSVDTFRAVRGQVPAFPPPEGRVSDALLARNVVPAQRGTAIEGRTREYLAANLGRRGEDDYSTARVFRRASTWLDRVSGDGPFALVIDAFGPHEPFDPPPRYLGLYGENDGRPEPINPFGPPIGEVSELGLDEEQLRRVRALYAGEVTFADAWLGRFLDKLDAAGRAQDTLVMVLSDHGVLLGEHGYLGKSGSQAYREIIDVPYIVRSPAGPGGSATSDFFASTHDVAPTVLAALDVDSGQQLDGEDLGPLIAGETGPERPAFTASYDDSVVAGDGRWLLISDNQGKQRRLYDDEGDPREQQDVASKHDDVTDRLWDSVTDAAGGELPRFGQKGVIEDG